MRTLRFARSAAIALTAASMLAACGGGARSVPPSSFAPSVSPIKMMLVPVTISIAIPSAVTVQAGARRGQYLSPATKSMSVAYGPVGASPATAIANCGSGVCTTSVAAPLGNDTFAVSLFDAAGATGNLLSSGTKNQMIVPGINNTVGLVFNGVVASIVVSVDPVAYAIGVPNEARLIVTAKDASGATIVGPGQFTMPIVIGNSDTSGAMKLESTSITQPGQIVKVKYNGGAVGNVTFSATTAGVTPSTTTAFVAAATAGPTNFRTGNIPLTADQLDQIPYANVPFGDGDETGQAHRRRPRGASINYTLPASADLRPKMSPVGAQSFGDCNAWANAAIVTYLYGQDRGWTYVNADGSLNPAQNISQSFIYPLITGGKDTGSLPTDALNLLSTTGGATLADWPYNTAQCCAMPSAAAIAAASPNRVLAYAQIEPTERVNIKAHIAAGFPIYFAAFTDDTWGNITTGTWNGPNVPSGGAHAMVLVGYDDSKNRYIVRNSWGTTWGDNGYGYIDYGFFEKVTYMVFTVKSAKPPVPPGPLQLPAGSVTGLNIVADMTDPQLGKGVQINGTLNVSAPAGRVARAAFLLSVLNADGTLSKLAATNPPSFADLAGRSAIETARFTVPSTGLAQPFTLFLPYSAIKLGGGTYTLYAQATVTVDDFDIWRGPLTDQASTFSVNI